MLETRCYPTSVSNNNIPDKVFIVANVITMSGEIQTTYYIDLKGNMKKCGDWIMDKPQSVSFSELYKLTGDTPKMISSKYENWKKQW